MSSIFGGTQKLIVFKKIVFHLLRVVDEDEN